MPFNEAKLDGTIEAGNQYKDFDPSAILISALNNNNWNTEVIEKSGVSILKCKMEIGSVSKNFAYSIGRIQNQEEGRNPNEKRIQLSPKNTSLAFDYVEDENSHYAIIGVYKREKYNDTIFCGWPKNAIKTPNTQLSLRVKIDLIAEALIKGFASKFNDANQLVCAFRPEFVHYYLLNKDNLHSKSSEISLPFKRVYDYPYNLIYFGAPGTGKSHEISKYTTDSNSIKITFHPDTDYAAFVGSYKPVQLEDGAGITYSYVAQAFLKAYTKAWETEEQTFLIIEEINRGNCAQIFGDIFQMIERKADGYSKYEVDVDSEIEKHLRKHYKGLIAKEGRDAGKAARYMEYFHGEFNKMALPNNLFIHATMNTSDQSLFPIDSAFKRRWDWEYVPIEFDGNEADEYEIIIGKKKYSWRKFIEVVNDKIKIITDSEDKKLGQFFIKSHDKTISEKVLKSKVMFYIWSDILKDELQSGENYFFRRKESDDEIIGTTFTFSDLFIGDSTSLLSNFMKYLGVKAKEEDGEIEATAISEE